MDRIIGAGLSGLICGALNAKAHIYERNAADTVTHRALLRFRDDRIAQALGLSFRRVPVRKAIWYDGAEAAPSPRIANLYSRKVRGIVADASIWNIGPSERFIAPDNLHAILADICHKRVTWNCNVTLDMLLEMRDDRLTVTSTIPLPTLLKTLNTPTKLKFGFQPIIVNRFAFADCEVYQTIYFPQLTFPVYRATLTGNILTVESTTSLEEADLEQVCEAFGIQGMPYVHKESQHRQQYGKIAPVPDAERKALLHHITQTFGIYSLGRFATWRNILLDDVFTDISAIKRMMTLSHYDHAIAVSV